MSIRRCFFIGIFAFFYTVGVFSVTFAAGATGTIDTTFYKAKVCHNTSCASPGFINFRATTSTSPVALSDSGGLSGYAWGDEIGWINFSPTHGGVTINPTTGALSGYAWSQNTGWINFSPTHGGVSVTSSGEFSGWAWASGAYGGWIKFDCLDAQACVKTDWRPLSARGTTGGGGGGGVVYIGGPSGTGNPSTPPPQPIIKTPISTVSSITDLPKTIGSAIKNFLSGLFGKKNTIAINTDPTEGDIPDLILDPSKYKLPARLARSLRVNTDQLMCKEPIRTCPYFTMYQQEGDIGGDIPKIQIFLNKLFPDKKLKITGRFDKDTVLLVKEFQKKYGSSAFTYIGVVDPTGQWYRKTRRMANEIVGCPESNSSIDLNTSQFVQ